MTRLPPSATTCFDDNGAIVSTAFDDCYFSKHDGLGETRAVFLTGAGLPDAWADKQNFVIGEIGFGTGLNVLATWDLWRKTRPTGAMLHIITVEGFLLDAPIAGRAHAAWPELASLSEALLKRWPRRVYGPQRICFAEDGFCLTVLVGQGVEVLRGTSFQANAWFLDGFSPAKNPDLWSGAMFEEIARLSAPRARLATYSVASGVRAGLSAAGFEVHKAQGYGHKRHRLEGMLVRHPMAIAQPTAKPQRALVIGGGIAGAAACSALLRRGLQVQVVDNDPCGRTKASGNPVAILMPRLDRGETREARFFRAAYVMACDVYRDMGSDAFNSCGVLESEKSGTPSRRLADLARDPPLPPDMLIASAANTLLHKCGGVLFPDAILSRLTQGGQRIQADVASLTFQEGQWCARNGAGAIVAQADIAIIAAGHRSSVLHDLAGGMGAKLGQVSMSPLSGDPPDLALSGGSYCAPFGDKLVFGATYDNCDPDAPVPAATQDAHSRNRQALERLAPDLAARIDPKRLFGRTAVRATTFDHMPIAGPAQPDEGLYMLSGLGSRGFTTAFLCAEIIASQACHEPSPVALDVEQALAPDRFLRRATKAATGC